jgi:glucose-6-phosphate dehydrogenase assembly protein OpcA
VTDHIEDLLLAWEQADEIIVDSELGAHEEETSVFRSLLDAHDRQNLLFSDLAWRRLTPFREAVATLFDTNDAVASLREIARVVVMNLPAASSLLFTSWLAARLGWVVQDEQEYRDAAGRTVTVEIDRSTDDIASAEARFETFDGRELSARADGSGCVQLERGNGSPETRVYAIPTLGESLMDELDDTKLDEVFLETVALLAR